MSTYTSNARNELLEAENKTGDWRNAQIAVEKAKVWALLDIADALRNDPNCEPSAGQLKLVPGE